MKRVKLGYFGSNVYNAALLIFLVAEPWIGFGSILFRFGGRSNFPKVIIGIREHAEGDDRNVLKMVELLGPQNRKMIESTDVIYYRGQKRPLSQNFCVAFSVL